MTPTNPTPTQQGQTPPDRIWMRAEVLASAELREHFVKLNNNDIEYVRAAVAGPRGDESGWLLEKMHEGNVHYVCADNVLQWTDDPNKALRLARRDDAEALATIVEDCEKIAEHGWPAATSSPAPAESFKCTCLAASNQTAWEYVHHTNNCPVYIAGESAKQWLFDHPQLKDSRIFQGAAAWDRETVATLLVQYAITTAPPESTRVEGEQWRQGMRDAAKEVCDACDNEERYGPARKIEGSTRWWHGDDNIPCEAGGIWHALTERTTHMQDNTLHGNDVLLVALPVTSDSARRAAQELTAMFTELSNCYTASKGAATDREESLRLRGMAEAYADAARRCQEFPSRRRNDGTLITFAAAPAVNEAESKSLLPDVIAAFVTNAIRLHALSNHEHGWHDCLAEICRDNKELIRRARGERPATTTKGER